MDERAPTRPHFRIVAAAALIATHAGCASLGGLGSLVRAPQFRAADGRDAEIVLRGPSRDFPLGGAAKIFHTSTKDTPYGHYKNQDIFERQGRSSKRAQARCKGSDQQKRTSRR